jgi:MoxR-like ATPase
MTPTKTIGKVADFAASIRTKQGSAGQPDELIVDPYFQEDPVIAQAIEYAIKSRKNLLLVGPTGCGKSCLALNVMARLNERCEIHCLDGDTSVDNLMGKLLVTIDDKDNTVTDLALGPALRAYLEGKILLLEEIDMAVPDILASIHRIMETNQKFYVSNIGAQKILQKHKNFCVMGTANTIGTGEDTLIYAGTKPMNLAFMNRWSITIRMDYLPLDKEIKVLMDKTGIDQVMAYKMVRIANAVRDAANPQRIGGTLGSERIMSPTSTRDLLEWASAVIGMGIDFMTAAKYAFLNRVSDSDKDIVQGFIENEI